MTEQNTQAPETKKEEKAPVMVPESDLLAIKGSLEGQLKKLKEEGEAAITAAKLETDSTKTELLKERTAKEQLEKSLQEAGNFKNQFEELNKQLDTVKALIPVYENKVVETKRELISLQYGVDPKVLDGKTEAELDTLKEALKITGKGSNAGGNSFYERGSSQGTPSKAPFSRENDELEAIRKKS
jgi:hypothetical protein